MQFAAVLARQPPCRRQAQPAPPSSLSAGVKWIKQVIAFGSRGARTAIFNRPVEPLGTRRCQLNSHPALDRRCLDAIPHQRRQGGPDLLGVEVTRHAILGHLDDHLDLPLLCQVARILNGLPGHFRRITRFFLDPRRPSELH